MKLFHLLLYSALITNVHEMSAAVLDTKLRSDFDTFTSADSVNYGCKGRGNYDAFSKLRVEF